MESRTVLTPIELHPSATMAHLRTPQNQRLTNELLDWSEQPSTSPVFDGAANGSHDLQEKLLHSQKLAALGQLIASIAHDLNNPLTTVLGFAETMLQEENIPESARSDLYTIHEAAERASQIVKNILAFARKQRGPRPLVNVNDLIGRTLALRAHELRTSSITVVKELHPAIPPTLADPYQLQQVFLNLMINAEQAMLESHGKGRLVIQTRVSSSADRRWFGANEAHDTGAGEWIEIIFADDGPGIPVAVGECIFEPFFTTKPAGQGTGLGLAISHKIIQDHGGHLYARSQPGRGATFIIELPIAEEAPP